MLELVISRYNEDLTWLRDLPGTQSDVCAKVYNKGHPLPPTFVGVTELPNVGREAHTYLHHIIENYETLADYTVFLQGRPFDHCPDLMERLHRYEEQLRFGLVPLEDFIPLGHHCTCDAIGMPQHQLPIAQTYRILFNELNTPHSFTFVVGAQFVVSRKAIQSRSHLFYRRAIEMVNKDRGATINGRNDGLTWGAHIMERMWRYVFNVETL